MPEIGTSGSMSQRISFFLAELRRFGDVSRDAPRRVAGEHKRHTDQALDTTELAAKKFERLNFTAWRVKSIEVAERRCGPT
jgi:hypothetical protein